jgi:hypothetical protein
VLGPGGRLLATFFLLNLESRARIADGDAEFSFRVPYGDGFAEEGDEPEHFLAFEEKKVLAMLEGAGLELTEKRYGEWTGRPDGMARPDLIVATA